VERPKCPKHHHRQNGQEQDQKAGRFLRGRGLAPSRIAKATQAVPTAKIVGPAMTNHARGIVLNAIEFMFGATKETATNRLVMVATTQK
jgi:hypothetical protein